MKKVNGFICFVIISTIFFSLFLSANAQGINNTSFDSYTYWQQDRTKYLASTKPMVEVKEVLSADSLGCEELVDSTDITIDKYGNLYVLNGSKSLLYIFDKDRNLINKISQIGNETFTGAKGVFVANDDRIFIADTDNHRIIIVNSDLSLSKIISRPENEVIPDDFEFNPLKIALDRQGFIYVLSQGSFYGAVVFSKDYECQGFFGANTVNSTAKDVIESLWNKWVMTDEQRESQTQKIPFQFSDLCFDSDGLMYTTTGSTTNYATQYGQIRALGPSGINVLKYKVGRRSTSADTYNFADEGVAKLSVGGRTQNFVSIAVKDGFIYALDQTYGKVYIYNTNCELLTVFGGGVQEGIQKGTFKNATSLEFYDNSVYVLDSKKGSITVFELNDYAKMVMTASNLTAKGDYEAGGDIWKKVIKQDSNNQLAYKGLTKYYINKEDYSKALTYAKMGYDKVSYDLAFEKARNKFLEENITLIIVLSILLVAIIVFLVVFFKKKNKKIILPKKVSVYLKIWMHPFDNSREIKYKNNGSLIIAIISLSLFYLSVICKDYYSGFVFSDFNVKNYNSILTFVGSVGIVLLWSVSNWAISVLAEGKAKLKEVFITACYSLLPLIFGNFIYMALSNCLLENEATALTVIVTVCTILTGICLCIGTMIIQEFDFFKFLWTTIVSLIAMAVVIFLIFMIVILMQQFYAFIKTVFIEVVYR